MRASICRLSQFIPILVLFTNFLFCLLLAKTSRPAVSPLEYACQRRNVLPLIDCGGWSVLRLLRLILVCLCHCPGLVSNEGYYAALLFAVFPSGSSCSPVVSDCLYSSSLPGTSYFPFRGRLEDSCSDTFTYWMYWKYKDLLLVTPNAYDNLASI